MLETWRDWIIIVQGIIQIIFLLGLIVIVLVSYRKISNLIKKGEQTVSNIESTFTSTYYKAGEMVFGWLLKTLGLKGEGKNKSGKG